MFIKETTSENIVKNLSKKHVNLLFIAEHSTIDIEQTISMCNDQNITIAGGIFPMVINNVEAVETGVVLKVIKTDRKPHLVQDISKPFMDDLPDLRNSDKSGIVLMDGLSPDISKFLGSLYDKYWNNISYVGGGAGSLTLVQKPCVFTNQGIFQNAGLILLSGWETQLGVKHGWQKIAGPFVANKTEGNKVIELNWRPAFEVYKEVVESQTDRRFATSEFFDIAKGFPFGMYRDGQEDIVRDPIAVEEDGSLVCVGKVGQNTSLNILKGESDHLISNANLAAAQAHKDGANETFIADCISRILYLEEDFTKELQAVKTGLQNNGQPLEGILSIGEVSSNVNGYLEFFNKTIVVSSFY